MSFSNDLTLIGWILNVSKSPFVIDIGQSMTVYHLKKAIKKEKERAFDGIEPDTFELWKLSPPIPSAEIGTKLRDAQSPQQIQGCVKLDPTDKLSEHFSLAHHKHLHIIVELDVLPTPSRKHPRSLSAQGDDEAKKKRLFERRWSVNGAITVNEAKERYYVDPGTQKETELCLDAVSNGTYLLLAGARASGKTTRLLWLRQKLEAMGYLALYISLQHLNYRGSTRKDFWGSFGTAIANYGRGYSGGPTIPMSSHSDFISHFYGRSWDRKVVLLLDEFDSLHQAQDDVRDDCLQAFRELKQDHESHTVQCIIIAGTFRITSLNTSTRGIAPFNVVDIIQCTYFTIDETRRLFRDFAQDVGFPIDDAIVEDVWAKSGGHPGMVCLCGRTIFDYMSTLICHESRTISYNLWQQLPAEQLYGAISRYDTFYSMIESLSRPEVSSSINLLRSRFAGFLGDVTLAAEKAKEDADTLTSEGVLLRPNLNLTCYRMASPLVDGLIRNQLIPKIFPNATSSRLPLQQTEDADILGILIESLKFFDKDLILDASYYSYKTPKVKVSCSHVPRESVYDTELMRILASWLQRYDWSVISQWHLEDGSKKHKYSDIVLKKDDRKIVLGLLATGEPSSVKSHIQKTLQYATLLSANETWVIHFTRQENYHPIWQSDTESVNVVHFAHDLGFTDVVMSARWKDCAGEIQEVAGKSLPLD